MAEGLSTDTYAHTQTIPESLGIYSFIGQIDAETILIKYRNYYESERQREVTYTIRKLVLVVQDTSRGISGEVTWECLH